MEAQKAVYRIVEELKGAGRNLEILRLEQDQLLGEADDADEEMEKYNAALGRVSEEVRAAQARVAGPRRRSARYRRAWRTLTSRSWISGSG